MIEHFGVKNLELSLSPEVENYPFQYGDEDRLDLATFLPPQYPDDQAVLREWVAQFLPRRGTIHTRDILANLNAAIRSDFRSSRATSWVRSGLPRRSTAVAEPAATSPC